MFFVHNDLSIPYIATEDRDLSQRGFAAECFPKPLPQVRELGDSNLLVRQKSLLAAQELLGSPINYVQCVAAGITLAVISLLKVSM